MRWIAQQPVLTGDFLTLRPWEPEDAPQVFEACQDPAIQRWTTVPVPYEPAHARQFVSDFARSQWATRTGAPFAVVAVDGRLLGSCGLVGVSADGLTAEVGYWVAPWARGRGAASGALRVLSDWALRTLEVQRLEALIESDNLASAAAATQAGFRFTQAATRRADIRGERREVSVYVRTAGAVPAAPR